MAMQCSTDIHLANSAMHSMHNTVYVYHHSALLLCSEKKQWLVQKMENRQSSTRQQQLAILRGLVDADAFERFLASKFPASKVSLLPQSDKHLLSALHNWQKKS